jgi:chromosome segregation ATPase
MENLAYIGHNNPPSPIEIFEADMKAKYPEYFNRAQLLIDAKDRVPPEIKNEDEAKKVGDYLKQVKELAKTIDALREGEKQPFLEKCRVVDGTFGKWLDSLKQVRSFVDPIQAKWVQAKKDAAERARAEEAARKKAEAEEKLRQAQEAERKAQEERDAARAAAEAAQRQADEERRQIEADAAEKKRKQDEELRLLREAEETAARERQAEIDRLKAERAAAEEQDREEKRKAKEAIEAAERAAKEADKEAKRKIREEQEKAEEIEREKKAAEKAIKEKEREAEDIARKAEQAAKVHDRDAKASLNEAEKLERQSGRLEKVPAADIRVRGDQGSLSTTRIDWDGYMINRDDLDLEALRHHLREDDINHAIKQFVKAGGRTLKGASIFEETKLNVR